MKIKTRNFLISFLMLLTLVFGVFAFMPKTTMTASADENYDIIELMEEQLFEELDIGFRLGYKDYAVMGQKGFTATSGNGWELTWHKQEVRPSENFYSFLLTLWDIDPQMIWFDYEVKDGFVNQEVSFTIKINGDCSIPYISMKTADKEHVSDSTLGIVFAEYASLTSKQIFHQGIGKNGGQTVVELVGPKYANAYLDVGEICSTYYYYDYGPKNPNGDGYQFINPAPVRGYASGNLTITSNGAYEDRPVFSEGACWWSFGENVDLFLTNHKQPIFAEYSYITSHDHDYKEYEFNQPNQSGDPWGHEFIAYTDKGLALSKLEVGGYIPDKAKVGDAIDYRFWPTVEKMLGRYDKFDSNQRFQMVSSYELTNLSTLKEIASDSKVGSLHKDIAYQHDWNKDYFTYVSDKVPTFTEAGIYRLTMNATLYYHSQYGYETQTIATNTRTFYIVVDDENATCFDWITGGSVNSTPCADGETIKVPSNSATDPLNLKITYKNPIGLGEMEAEGWRLGVKCTKLIDNGGWVACEDYFESMTGDEITLTLYGNTDHAGSTRMFKVYLTLYNDNMQIKTDVYTVCAQVVDKYINIDSANINVGTPVAGQTPADVKGALTTEGLTINKETWYEVKGSSLRAMAEDEQFVAGKQYKYEVYLFRKDGYKESSNFYVTFNGKNNSGKYVIPYWQTKTSIVAVPEFSASAANETLTVPFGQFTTFKINAQGGDLSYVWTTESGAPDIGSATDKYWINVTGDIEGEWKYYCTVTDNSTGESKNFTFTLIVEEEINDPTDTFTPGLPGAIGGKHFLEVDSDGGYVYVDVKKGDGLVLTPNYYINTTPNNLLYGNKTPIAGVLTYTFTLYDSNNQIISKFENVEKLDLTEFLSTAEVGDKFTVALKATNTDQYGQENSNYVSTFITIVSAGATVSGRIEETEEATTYALRRLSARSSTNFEGTIVYLVRENEIVYATEANAQGYYTFTNVLYGSYSVMIEKEGYEDYNKPVEVNAAEVTHDVTIILHVCFNNEAGMLWHVPATQPTCSDVTEGTLGNIEYYSCQACGKFYDAGRNLIADSVADPYSVNDMGVPYNAIIYPVHDYCGEAQEGGNADQYLRHRAETCLEDTTYWYYCISCHKSAGDDPSAVDKYYVGSASNQTHSYTLEIADEYYHYDFHELGEEGKENCTQKVWYYHACEYCYAKGTTVWESNVYGAHAYGDLIPATEAIHTATELKGAVGAHYFCDVCKTYFDENYVETTLEMLTGAAPEHVDSDENGKCDVCEPTIPDDGGDNSGDSSEPDSSTPDSSSKDEGKKKGCFSAIGGIGVGMFALASAATFVFLKKRKEN